MKNKTVEGLKLRKAGHEDGPFLLSVRNDPEVRSRSKTQGIISENSHRTWFQSQLKDSSSIIWILENCEQPEGFVRAKEFETGCWLLSIALQPCYQGMGHGGWMLQEACRSLFSEMKARSIVAEVLSFNMVARRLFEEEGFVQTSIKKEDGLELVCFELISENS